jgi:hypothetical protein
VDGILSILPAGQRPAGGARVTAVRASQRFTRNNPCPACGGHKDLPAGRGIRCWGYIGDNGRVYCTRDSDGPMPKTPAKAQRAAEFKERPIHVIEYEIRDTEGRLQAIHGRFEYLSQPKQCPWRLPASVGWTGLHGRPYDTLPLFGSERLPALEDGAVVIVNEGEKDAFALRQRGFNSVGTVTGAQGTPSPEVLEPLKRFRVVYWPDADNQGREHVRRMAAIVPGAVIDWPGAGQGEGAADFSGSDEELAALINSANPERLPDAPKIDTEAVRERLAEGIEHWQGWEKADALRQCRMRFSIYRCPSGHWPAFPISCGNQLCPRCGPKKLASDWKTKLNLSDGLGLYELRPLQDFETKSDVFETVRKRFGKWRHGRILNGVYGVRFEAGMKPLVLLILPPGETVPDGGRAFDVKQVADAAASQEALQWLADNYLQESGCWQAPEELGLLLDASKKRRRFQCWGVEFQKGGSYVHGDADIGDMPNAPSGTDGDALEKNSNTGRNPPPSGGAGHAAQARKDVVCNICGAICDPKPMFTATRDQVQELAGGKGYIWKGKMP